MTILLAVASRHGSTREIGEAIAQELRTAGHAIDVRNIGDAPSVERYNAVIIGSAVSMGDWLPEARQFVERTRARLVGMPVWLFSSGPLGQESPQPQGDPAHLDEQMQAIGARGHRVYVGKLDKDRLGLGERLVARVVGAPEGDFRDWEGIRDWAREIAGALPAVAVPGA